MSFKVRALLVICLASLLVIHIVLHNNDIVIRLSEGQIIQTVNLGNPEPKSDHISDKSKLDLNLDNHEANSDHTGQQSDKVKLDLNLDNHEENIDDSTEQPNKANVSPTATNRDDPTPPTDKAEQATTTATNKIHNNDWQSQIDFVILWAGKVKTHANGTDIARERNNNEMVYNLRSIAQNAPWVHKIYILTNTGATLLDNNEIPASILNKTNFVDRCSFMPNGTCPSRNSQAVKTFAHRTPGLSEHFILVDDDIFLGRPVTPDHFFEDGKPFVWRKRATWGFFGGQEFHRIYKDPSVVDFRTPNSSAPCPHFYHPQLKSVCESMENQYPEFYAFVGSHKDGRYSSLAKGPSDEHNSQEESPMGWLNWEYLSTGQGVFKNIDSKRGEWWEEVDISEAGFKKAIKDRPIFMNVNDRFSKNPNTYDKQIKWFHDTMNIMFPGN